MEKIGRQRRNEGAWREIVERQAQSGLTVAAFCEREGLRSASLCGWRSRLRNGSKDNPRVVSVKKAKASDASPASSSFINLGSLGSSLSRFEVRLDLGAGIALHLVRI